MLIGALLLAGCATRHPIVGGYIAPHSAGVVCDAGWSQADRTCWRYLPSARPDASPGVKCSMSMRGAAYSTVYLCEKPAVWNAELPVESAGRWELPVSAADAKRRATGIGSDTTDGRYWCVASTLVDGRCYTYSTPEEMFLNLAFTPQNVGTCNPSLVRRGQTLCWKPAAED